MMFDQRKLVADAIFQFLSDQTGNVPVYDCAEAFGSPAMTARFAADGKALDEDLLQFEGQFSSYALADAVLAALGGQ